MHFGSNFEKKEKKASQKQIELIVDLAGEVDVAVNTDGLTIEEASNKIEELKEAKATNDAIAMAEEKDKQITMEIENG